MTASALEHVMFEETLNIPAVSAIKALEVASTQGILLHRVDLSNLQAELASLQVVSEVKTDIQNAVNAGLVVTVSERNVQVNDWNGVGYIILNPTTGEGEYRISGGLSGGSLTQVAQGLQALIKSKQMTLQEAKDFILSISKRIYFYPPAPPECQKTRGFSNSHKGIDYGCNNWTPVDSVGAGMVTRAEFSDGQGGLKGYGLVVYIYHGGSIETRYAHNCELKVSLGQQVTIGQTIAMSGNTGDVEYKKSAVPKDYPRCSNEVGFQNGAHIHFEIRLNGDPVDPEIFNIRGF